MKANTSRVDWLTATSVSQKTGMNWLELFNKYRGSEPCKQVRMHGFVGLSSCGLIWAQREADQRFMCIASSDAASHLWRRIGMFESRITRVDLAVDMWCDPALPWQVYNSARVFLSPHWDADRIKRSLFKSTTGGQTLYVGSRQSQLMGRFYDKGVESGVAPPGKWYRYEVEVKKPASTKVYSDLEAAWADGQVDKNIRSWVHEFFSSRYIVPLFSAQGTSPAPRLASIARARTDNKKKIAWIRTQVRPSVGYLFEAGLGESAIEALGLDTLLPADNLIQLKKAAKNAAKKHTHLKGV